MKVGFFLQEKIRTSRRITKEVLGQRLWARGYFCATVGAVNEEMIKQYVENQTEDEGEFKIWDLELQTAAKELQSDCYPVK